MNAKAALVFVVGVAFLLSLSVFTVDERERAIKLQLGEVRRFDYEPGLHFKLPVFQNVVKFDGRVQTLDSDPQLFLTNEKKQVFVDSFVKWKVEDVERFYTSVSGNVQQANGRLTVVISKQLKDEFGQRNVQEVVSGERTQIMERLMLVSKAQSDELGIKIIDVRIKRVDLPGTVSESVYKRMAAERTEVANRFRSEGEERARELRAEADREQEVIIANAERDAQILRGSGDARATDIYARAFGQDREFFTFYRSIGAYRNSFNNPSDILLLEPNTEFFKYFKDPMGGAGD